MIFAAGLGTRLRPLTDRMPKALVPVGRKPLLQHVIEKLARAGFTRIVVNVHHFAEQIIDFLSEHQNFGLDISVSDEREMLLETGGGIKKAIPLFDPERPVLIHNVDILSNIDLAATYQAAADSDALLVVSQRETSRYLLFTPERNLVGWTNIQTGEVRGPIAAQPTRPQLQEQDNTMRFAFSGIHVISPTLLERMSNYPERFPIIDFYLQECATARIKALPLDNLRLLDVGKLNTLHEAQKFLADINNQSGL